MTASFITCAVTGSGDTVGKSDKVPFTPEAIANDCIAAARAGAAVVHIHVRDPLTGAPSREVEYYAEVVDRVRSSDVDPVINLTAGMGVTSPLDRSSSPCRWLTRAPTWSERRSAWTTSARSSLRSARSTAGR